MQVRIPTEQLCQLGVFCFDPGFKAGLAVVSLDEETPRVVYLDAMKTDGDAIVRRDAILALSKLKLTHKSGGEVNLPGRD